MTQRIHPTALVHAGANVSESARIGPYCLVESGAVIGAGCVLGPFSRVLAGGMLEEDVTLDGGAVIGGAPQDLKFAGGPTRAVIGSGSRIGEYATVNRAAIPGGETRVGQSVLVMAYAHVAHDCVIGERAVIANSVQLGGHARVGEGAVLSGMTGVHQFTCIGAGAFVGGGLRVDQDIPPFCRAMGDPLRWGGLNLTGLRRRNTGGGAEEGVAAFLDAFYRRLYKDEAEALGWMRAQPGFEAEKDALADFSANRKRALLRRRLGAEALSTSA
jgi:UDP-N-acetylglucosamine acyltransferase